LVKNYKLQINII